MREIINSMIKSWLAKTPKVAKVLQYVAISLTVLTGFPDTVNSVLEPFGFQLLSSIQEFANKYTAIATGALAFLLQFTTTKENEFN